MHAAYMQGKTGVSGEKHAETFGLETKWTYSAETGSRTLLNGPHCAEEVTLHYLFPLNVQTNTKQSKPNKTQNNTIKICISFSILVYSLECYRCKDCLPGELAFLQDTDKCSSDFFGLDKPKCYKNVKEDGSMLFR